MTVKELIQELLNYDMDSEVRVNCKISEYETEDELYDFNIEENHQFFGNDKVFINVELEESK